MKTVNVTIGGEKRVLCYSLRVVNAIEDTFGGEAEMRAKLSSGKTSQAIDITTWLMAQMMLAGKQYADKNGIPCPEPLTQDDLLDNCDVNDMLEMQKQIQAALAIGSKQDVEAEGKNAGTTPAR